MPSFDPFLNFNFNVEEIEALLEEYNRIRTVDIADHYNDGSRYIPVGNYSPSPASVQYLPAPPRMPEEVKEVIDLAKRYKAIMLENYQYRCKRPERELLEKLFAALEKV